MLIWPCRFRFMRPDVVSADSIRLKIWRDTWDCRSSSPCDEFGEHHPKRICRPGSGMAT
jgi:hypothetical protein